MNASAQQSPASMRYLMLAIMTFAQAGASLLQQGIGSLSPFLIAAFAITNAQIGVLFTAIMIASALFVPSAGFAVDRYGERPVILTSGIVMGVAIIVAAFVPWYAGLIPCMFALGVGYAFTTPAGGRAILTWFQRDRGFAMGVRQMGVTLGGAVAGFMLPFLAVHGGYKLAFIGGGITTIVISLLAVLVYRDPPARDDRKAGPGAQTPPMSAKQILRHPAVIACTLAGMALVATQACANGFISVTAIRDVRASVAVAAASFAIMQIAATIARAGWGVVSDRYFGGDRMLLTALLCIASAAGTVLLALTRPGGEWLLLGSAALVGASGIAWNGLYTAVMAEIGGTQAAGRVMGIGLSFVFLSSAAAPPLFGALADRVGLPGAWIALSLVTGAGFIPSLYARRILYRT